MNHEQAAGDLILAMTKALDGVDIATGAEQVAEKCTTIAKYFLRQHWEDGWADGFSTGHGEGLRDAQWARIGAPGVGE